MVSIIIFFTIIIVGSFLCPTTDEMEKGAKQAGIIMLAAGYVPVTRDWAAILFRSLGHTRLSLAEAPWPNPEKLLTYPIMIFMIALAVALVHIFLMSIRVKIAKKNQYVRDLEAQLRTKQQQGVSN